MAFTLDYYSGIVSEALEALDYPTAAPRLYDPIRYTLESGGKRLRPILTLATYEALAHADARGAAHQAAAIELFHNFTLLHDDVMDKAEIRRGRPTVHCKWNSNAAILSGDAMLTLASIELMKCPADKLAALNECFNRTAMEVYAGQQLDMEYESRTDIGTAEYMEMIRLKTSVLLACACRLGAIMAGASEADAAALYNYGLYLGLAFQMRDDWLDTYGDPAIFGKQIGGDIVNRKKTWLLTAALEEARQDTLSIINEDLEDDILIDEVRRLYDSLGLSERCSALAADFSRRAADCLAGVAMDYEARTFFESLAESASTRDH